MSQLQKWTVRSGKVGHRVAAYSDETNRITTACRRIVPLDDIDTYEEESSRPCRRCLGTPEPLPFGLADLRVEVWASTETQNDDVMYRCLERWEVKLSASVNRYDNELLFDDIGHATIYRMDMDFCYRHGLSAWEICDEEYVDIRHLSDAAFRPKGGLSVAARKKLGEDYYLADGEDVLLFDDAYIQKEYRGHGLGVIMAGLALHKLRKGTLFAVCQPAPRERSEGFTEEEKTAACKSLGKTWAKLGFEPFEKDVALLDLTGEKLNRWYEQFWKDLREAPKPIPVQMILNQTKYISDQCDRITSPIDENEHSDFPMTPERRVRATEAGLRSLVWTMNELTDDLAPIKDTLEPEVWNAVVDVNEKVAATEANWKVQQAS